MNRDPPPPQFHPGHLKEEVFEGGEFGGRHGGSAIPRESGVVPPKNAVGRTTFED